MKVNEFLCFMRRTEADAHASTIHDSKAAQSVNKFTEFMKIAFSCQPAVFPTPIDINLPLSKFNYSDKKNIAYMFYKNHYKPAMLNKGNRTLGAPIDPNNFVKYVLRHEKTGNKTVNTCTFLLGDVGSGKTSYVNYLLTIIGEKMYFK
ncbi:hypothetical protein EPN96_04995 [bacterium]|nr:MAG: hypothetical protein EPN96_04995 [bacterium]